MKLNEYLSWLVGAYNPNHYSELLEGKFREFMKFLLITIGFSVLMFTILIIPITLNYLGSIPEMTMQIQTLKLDADVEASHPIELLSRPSIVLDLQSNDSSGGITLNNEGIIYPKYLFFGESMVRWGEVNDLKQETPVRDRFLKSVVIFIIPSIMFWFFIYSMIKIFLFSLLLFALGIILPRIFRHKISAVSCAKVLVLSIPSLLFIDLGFYPLAPLFWWGAILTAILFFIGIALVSERQKEEHYHHDKRKV